MLVGCWLVAGWLFGWLFIGWLLGTTRVRRRAAPAPGDGWVCGWQVSVRLLVGFLKLLGGLWSCWLAAPRALGNIPECSYSSARSGAICRNKASWNPGSWSTSLARPVRSRCASLRGFRHAFGTTSGTTKRRSSPRKSQTTRSRGTMSEEAGAAGSRTTPSDPIGRNMS